MSVALQGHFDPNAVDRSAAKDFDVIPAGEYPAKIIETKEYPNNKGTGRILELVWEIIDGQFKNRRIWQRLNYIHQNSTAQAIAQAQLAQVTDACGIQHALRDTSAIEHRPMRIKVKVKTDKTGQYDPQNEVAKVMPYAGNPAGAPAAQPPAAAPPAQAAPQANAYAPQGQPPAQPQPGSAPWAGHAGAPGVDDDIPF